MLPPSLIRRFVSQTALISLLSLSTCCAFAQPSDKQKPFAKFDGPPAAYLKRLHGRPGPLAWRTDFPGGEKAWRKTARAKHRELLGLDRIAKDARGHQPRVELEPPIDEGHYTRRRGRIETEPSVSIPFWLLTPKSKKNKKTPLALCAHGHNANGWNIYAGVYSNERERAETLAKDGDPAVQAVRRGYIALAPATRGLARAVSIPDLKGRHGNRPCRAQLVHCLLAGRTAVGERVWDTQRLLDWALREIPAADPKRVVMLGNSGGGVLTVHTAALDERIRIAVPSCSFSSFTSATGFVFHCDCCLIPRAQSELGDMADIGSLTAPRPLLAVHGRKDGLHSFQDVEAAMARVHRVYEGLKASDKFEHRWGEDGHKFYPDIMWPFIDRHLKGAVPGQSND